MFSYDRFSTFVLSVLFLFSGAVVHSNAFAQFTPPALESAATLDAAVNALNARSAQPSTHLLLDVPDIALPGKLRARLSSQIPGTTTLALVRGAFQASATPVTGLPTPDLARRTIGELPASHAPTVWLGSVSFKGGQASELSVDFSIEKTESLTMFALAQGRWWFVTREIKVGPITPPSKRN